MKRWTLWFFLSHFWLILLHFVECLVILHGFCTWLKKIPNPYYLNKTIFEILFNFFFNSLCYQLFHDWSAILLYGQIYGFDYIWKFPYFPMKLKDNPKVSIIMCTPWKFGKTKESFAPYLVKSKVHVTTWLSQYEKIANLKSRTSITPFLHHSYSSNVLARWMSLQHKKIVNLAIESPSQVVYFFVKFANPRPQVVFTIQREKKNTFTPFEEQYAITPISTHIFWEAKLGPLARDPKLHGMHCNGKWPYILSSSWHQDDSFGGCSWSFGVWNFWVEEVSRINQ